MQKRVLALLLAVAMVVSLLPVTLVSAEEATPGYSMILQKAHSQTEGELAVDLYLQANTAEQADVTGYQFTVTPAEGLTVTGVTDAIGNENIAGAGNVFIYDPAAEKPIAVGTDRVRVATITVAGDALPADYAAAIELTATKVVQAGTDFADVPVTELSFGCTDHACGHGEGQWTALTAEMLNADGRLGSGNYYLVEDVQLTKYVGFADKAKVTICLNGFDITAAAGERMFRIENIADKEETAEDETFLATEVVFNLCDCTATGTDTDYESGKLIPKQTWGGAIRVGKDTDGTVNIYGGIIDGTATDSTDGGAGIFVKSGTLNIQGGKFVGLEGGTVDGEYYGPFELRGSGTKVTIANATFVDCGTDIIDANTGTDSVKGAVDLTVKDVTITNSKADAHGLKVSDRFNKVTLEGNCQFDAPVFVSKGKAVSLNLGSQANVTLVTAEGMTAEDFTAVNVGAKFTAGTVFYENAGEYLALENGKIVFSSHAHDDVSFKPWRETDSLPTEGNYYLEKNVNLTGDVVLNHTLNLDLNGKTITQTKAGKRVFTIHANGTLNLYDCAEQYDEEGTHWTGGVITGGTHATGAAIDIYRSDDGETNNGVFNMYGGRISGNGTNAVGTSGGAVYIGSSRTQDGKEAKGGVFNMYGGEIYNNKSGQLGGAVTVWGLSNKATTAGYGAQFNMYGGKIHGNTNLNTTRNDANADDVLANGTIHVVYDAVFTMTGGEISNNTADRGGAVSALSGGTVNITGGTFINNSAKIGGGAVYLGSTGTTVTIADSTFTGNSASYDYTGTAGEADQGVGGVFFQENGTLNVTGSTFKGNSVTKGTNTDTYSGIGGVMHTKYSNATFTDCLFTDNTAASYGSVLSTKGGKSTVTFDGCEMTENNGIMVIYTLNNNQLNLHDTKIHGNTGINNGTVYITSIRNANNSYGGHVTLSGATVISGNSGGKGKELVLQNTAGRETPLVTVDGLTKGAHVEMTYANSTFNESVTADQVLQAGANQSLTDWNCGYVTYHKTTSDAGQNISYVNGAFVFGHWHGDVEYTATSSIPANPTAGNFYLTADVTENSASSPAAGYHLCLNGHTIKQGTTNTRAFNPAADNVFEDCTAGYDKNGHLVPGTGGTISGFNGTNGAVFSMQQEDDHLTLRGITIKNNNETQALYGTASAGFGGVIQVRTRATLVIEGCRLENNSCLSDGGAIDVWASSRTTVTDTVFEGNHASRRGGAIYAGSANTTSAPTVSLTNCEFVGNYATTRATSASDATATAATGLGGAIYAINTNLTVNGCTFNGNYVTVGEGQTATGTMGQGGAIFMTDSSNLDMDNSVFNGNWAGKQGGALYYYGATGYAADINGGLFEGNYVLQGDGGAVYVYSGNADVNIIGTAEDPVVFKNNVANPTATGSGRGAALGINNAKLDVKYANFIGNQGYRGGAVVIGMGTGVNQAAFEDCQFQDNITTEDGGVMQLGNGDVTFTRCKFTGNSAKSGGVLYTSNNTNAKTALFDGCTITGNHASVVSVIYMASIANVTIKDSRITDNYVTNGYGAINHDTADGNLFVEGSTYIWNNTQGKDSGAQFNIYMRDFNSNPVAATVTENGLTADAKIGFTVENGSMKTVDGAEQFVVDRTEFAVTNAGTANYLDYFVVDHETHQTYVKDNAIYVAQAEVGGTKYGWLKAALDTAPDEQIELLGNVRRAVEASANVKINLNGHNISKLTMPEGAAVSLVDTATIDYDCSDGYGKVTVEGAYEPVVLTTDGGTRRYVTIKDADGTVSAHRVYLAINTKVLRPYNNGVGFKAIFVGDEVVKANLDSFGLEVTVDQKFADGILTAEFKGFEAGRKDGTATPNQRTGVITNVLMEGEENEANAAASVYGRPVMVVDGQTVKGNIVSTSLSALAANALANGTDEVKAAVNAMLAEFGLN